MAEKDQKVRDHAWWVSNGMWLCHHVGGKGNWVHDSGDDVCRHCGEPRPPPEEPKQPTPSEPVIDEAVYEAALFAFNISPPASNTRKLAPLVRDAITAAIRKHEELRSKP